MVHQTCPDSCVSLVLYSQKFAIQANHPGVVRTFELIVDLVGHVICLSRSCCSGGGCGHVLGG